MFILAGCPLVESTHNDLRFTAPLTAITAASAIIAVAAAIALMRCQRNVIQVIFACVAAGYVAKSLLVL